MNDLTIRGVLDERLAVDDREDPLGGARCLGHVREGHLGLGQAHSPQHNRKETPAASQGRLRCAQEHGIIH